MLAHINKIAFCSWWRFVGCTSRARSSRSTTSQKMLYLVEIWRLWGPF